MRLIGASYAEFAWRVGRTGMRSGAGVVLFLF
jgi:hypothetical protein